MNRRRRIYPAAGIEHPERLAGLFIQSMDGVLVDPGKKNLSCRNDRRGDLASELDLPGRLDLPTNNGLRIAGSSSIAPVGGPVAGTRHSLCHLAPGRSSLKTLSHGDLLRDRPCF